MVFYLYVFTIHDNDFHSILLFEVLLTFKEVYLILFHLISKVKILVIIFLMEYNFFIFYFCIYQFFIYLIIQSNHQFFIYLFKEILQIKYLHL